MNRSPSSRSLPASLSGLIEYLELFEQAWQEAKPPDLGEFMSSTARDMADPLARRQLLEELVKIDLEYRWRPEGVKKVQAAFDPIAKWLPARPMLEHYVAFYSELTPSGPTYLKLVAEEYRVRWRWGDKPGHASYALRFPHHSGELTHRLLQVDQELHREPGPPPPTDQESAEAATTSGSDIGAVSTNTAINIKGYEILGELGHGGMGVVYKAWQIGLKRFVALKMIRAGAHADGDQKARFRGEGEKVASLDHPNIVEIYDIGEHDGCPFFSMEYVEGGSLDKHIAGNPQDPREAAKIVEKLARALQSAHERKIINRDLKPANILLKAEGGRGKVDKAPLGPFNAGVVVPLSSFTPMVTDFGLAKDLSIADHRTVDGQIMGTPSYMPPEQASGRVSELGPLVDVYALGAILYDLLTGRPPFKGINYQDTLNQVKKQEPIPPSRLQPTVPRDLETICLKCLEKDPVKRYGSAGDLAAELQRFLRNEPILARLPGITERAVQMIVRHQYGRKTTAWGWAHMLCGGTNLVGYLAQAWCIATEQPEGIFWGTFLAHFLLLAIVCWGALRGSRIGRGDRLGINFLTVAIAGPILVPILYTRPEWMELTAYRLSLFPLFALLHGIICFPQGSIYWGGYYLMSAGFVVLALVMKLFPTWSPVLFGLYLSSNLVASGLFLLRLGRSPNFRR